MDSIASFHYGNWRDIAMLLADCIIVLPSSFYGERGYGIHLYSKVKDKRLHNFHRYKIQIERYYYLFVFDKHVYTKKHGCQKKTLTHTVWECVNLSSFGNPETMHDYCVSNSL